MAFIVQLGKMRKPELHSPADDVHRLYVAVGLGHDASIHASRFYVGRSPVVFCRLSHGLYLLWTEPLMQPGILPDDAARNQMVPLASFHHTGVVVGGNGIDHVAVQLGVMPGQLHALCHDGVDMV